MQPPSNTPSPSLTRLSQRSFSLPASSLILEEVLIGHDDRPFGLVDDLIVEGDEVRYLDVRLLDDISGLQEEMRMLIPVGAVSRRGERWCVPSVDLRSLLRVPCYQASPLRRDYERAVLKAFGVETPTPAMFYHHTLFDVRALQPHGARRSASPTAPRPLTPRLGTSG